MKITPIMNILNGTRMLGTWLAVALIALGFSVSATENPPEFMTYQGYLADGNGDPLGMGTPENYDVVFSIFKEPSNGSPLWSEQQNVTVADGYFSVLLGEGGGGALSPVFSGADASERFIQIGVKGIKPGDATAIVPIMPRLKLVASPYAFLATRVVGNAIGSDEISDGAVANADLATDSVSSLKIENNSILAIDLAPDSVGSSEIAEGAVGSSEIANGSVAGVDLADNAVYSAKIANYSIHEEDMDADSVGSLAIKAGAVGNSELASSLTLNGSIGINGQSSVVSLYQKLDAGDYYSQYIVDTSGNLIQYQEKSGLLHLFTRYANNPSAANVLEISSVTPGSFTDTWSLRIDTDDGNKDEDLFFFLNGVEKGYIDGSGGGFYASSDRRLKQDITPLENPLQGALKLLPKTYHFKSNPDGPLQIGLIAQDVQEVFPSMVSEEDGMLAMSYSGFGVIAIGAVQELNKKVETLEAENAALNARLTALEELVQSLSK